MPTTPAQPRQSLPPDDDYSWLFPPKTLVDPAPWDQFWRNQMTSGFAGLVDMFCDDERLVNAMREHRLKTVLCVGNGLSQEPRALAWAGFEVTALDLSPLAMEMAQAPTVADEYFARLVGEGSARTGGTVQFVTGNLCDLTCCPGPYDVVIERKTLQLFPDTDRPAAMAAVAHRLASPGVFFSHCHDGGWKPPASPNHRTRSWFVSEGWPLWSGDTPLTSRVAWLFTSTG